jgi:hypothetical protein
MDRNRRNWKRLLKKHQPLQLVAACDALTAKLIIEEKAMPLGERVRQTINKVVKKTA